MTFRAALRRSVQNVQGRILALNFTERRSLPPLYSNRLNVFTESVNGTLQIAPAVVSVKGSSHLVLFNFIKGRVERLWDAKGAFVTTAVVGVRIKARVTAMEGGIALGSLTALDVSADAGQTRGELYVQVIGFDSQSISDLMPFSAEVDQSAVQTVLQSLSAITSKMWDTSPTVTPHLVSYAPVQGLDVNNLAYCRAESGVAPAALSGIGARGGIDVQSGRAGSSGASGIKWFGPLPPSGRVGRRGGLGDVRRPKSPRSS